MGILQWLVAFVGGIAAGFGLCAWWVARNFFESDEQLTEEAALEWFERDSE